MRFVTLSFLVTNPGFWILFVTLVVVIVCLFVIRRQARDDDTRGKWR